MASIAAESNLLFGLLALQNGLIDQDQLLAAFRGWTRDRSRPLAEYLAARADLDPEQRAGVEAMVGLHLRKHGGSAAKSLAAYRSEDARDPLRNRAEFRLTMMDLALPAEPCAMTR
jgi:hypothetical protein